VQLRELLEFLLINNQQTISQIGVYLDKLLYQSSAPHLGHVVDLQPFQQTLLRFWEATFVTNLTNGAAGDLANALATNSIYACRMFGNTFTPCARGSA